MGKGVHIRRNLQRRFLSFRNTSTQSALPEVPAEDAGLKIKSFNEIPGPSGIPYIGTAYRYRVGPYSVATYRQGVYDQYQKYGPITKETILGETKVRLFSPDYIQKMYYYDGTMPKIPALLETTTQYRKEKGIADGLGHTNGEQWLELRTAVQPEMMRPRSVAAYIPGIEEVCKDFVARIARLKNSQNEVDNFHNEIAKWNLENSGNLTFGRRLGYLESGPDSECQKIIDSNIDLFHVTTQLKFKLPLHKFMKTKDWRTIVEAEDLVYDVSKKEVDITLECIAEAKKSGTYKEGDYKFISYLLSKKEISYGEVVIVALPTFTDGLHTTTSSAAYTLYCFAKNPEVQQKAYDEIKTVMPSDEPLTGDMLNKLVYLRSCLKEVQRLFPITLDVSRITQEDVVIGGYRIPSGTLVEINNFVVNRDPAYFPEPELFRPERWMRDSSTSIHPFALTPFSFGPRMCAGKRLSEQDIYVLMVNILKRFKVGWNGPDLGQIFRTLNVPDKAVRCTFQERVCMQA